MKRSTVGSLAFLLLIAFSVLLARPEPAAAQEAKGFAVNKVEPSDRGSDWFTAESLDLRGAVRPAVGVVGDYARGPLLSRATNGDVAQRVVENLWTVHLGAAVNLADRLRFAANLPVIASISGREQTIAGAIYRAPAHEQGIGDVRFGADLRVGGTYGEGATVALGFRAWAPTGAAATYTGDGSWRFDQSAIFAGEAGIFAWGLHIGYTYRDRAELFDGATIGGSGASFGAAVGLKVLDKRLLFGPEVAGNTLFDDPFAKATTPIQGLFGAHFNIASGLRVGAAAGTGLLHGVEAPEFRGLFVIEWMLPAPLDRDGDGIVDSEDACPDVKGKPSDDPKKNGCPEPTPEDKDGDGVPDKDDACPDVPGVKTNDPKTNGCPPDRDGDGVPDKEDACPDVFGVKTNDPKTNGCPSDRDGDGVPDKEDACPDVAGIKTSDPKTNGCPEDDDIDKDGIPNIDDACPDEPGPPDPDPKKNGCPKAYIKADQIKIIDQVKFKTGSAQIQPGKDSEEILQAVLKVLTAHPEVKKVRVEGHTDNRGTIALNMKLSADRAASVVKWFVAHGIAQDRLTSQGFGPSHPISGNATEQGRKDNRRVEFHIETPGSGGASP